MSESDRSHFEPAELAVVLSYYDVGVIESITDYPRGSRESPKVGIVADRGKFLLKRRATRRADPERVRFAHRVQGCLETVGFPIGALIRTRNQEHTFVQLREHVYELFEFVPGQVYRQTLEETVDAGRLLAHFHDATATFKPAPGVAEPRGEYHDAPGVRTGLCAIGSSLRSHDSFSGDDAALAGLLQWLLEAYDKAAEIVNEHGFSGLPQRVTHSDWHPGNLLFRRHEAIAVVDYDSVRWSRRIADVANGLLQFSMLSPGDPTTWPAYAHKERFAAFLGAYESRCRLSKAERLSLPHLMIEALIAECVAPIAETRSVGQWGGYRVLQMVKRKVTWFASNSELLLRS